jgi:hypothetical protein
MELARHANRQQPLLPDEWRLHHAGARNARLNAAHAQ